MAQQSQDLNLALTCGGKAGVGRISNNKNTLIQLIMDYPFELTILI